MKIPFFSQRQNRSAISIPAEKSSGLSPSDIILHYHEQTKHHYYRFARSLGYLDWDNQPNPFRRFEGAPLFRMPLLPLSEEPSYTEIFQQTSALQEFSYKTLSKFFRNALALSAWKRVGDVRWSLRINPSSGNLHPTEGYLILPDSLPEIPAGVYHYAPHEHALEQRASLDSELIKLHLQQFPECTFFVGLTSIHWRESWKYGERAYRYCQHDAGHALAALRISAAVLGWHMVLLDELSEDDVGRLLGLNRAQDFEQAEDEHPDYIAAIFPAKSLPSNAFICEELIKTIGNFKWTGKANLLSESHAEWEIIDDAARASYKTETPVLLQHPISAIQPQLPASFNTISAEQIIQQRRSCLALDGVSSISHSVFYSILSSVVPSLNAMPFDSLLRSELATPRIHLALFVHRVDGVEPGLYFLIRKSGAESDLKTAMNSKFQWKSPEGCPTGLNLFLLEAGDFRGIATGVACGQEIGGAGVFSLGMIADFKSAIRDIGPWMYRRLFWESGVIGQVLYLQAEAAGIRSTGIGCYFDDPMHELLGLKDHRYQDLYHFTMGGNVEDSRLTTEPAYPE
jgi:SagB-type dehydrogenase family enzyme